MDEFPIVPAPVPGNVKEEEYERLYSPPLGIIIILSLLYGSISILSIVGNALVIWVVVTTRHMHTVTNIYIANLAVADVIIGLFCIPFQFQAALLQRWNLPYFMCGFCPFVQALSVNVSVFTLTAVAVDRHRAVINPLRARPSKCVSKLIITGIWIVSTIFALPCAIAFRVDEVHERVKEAGLIYNITRPFCMNMNLTENQLQIYRYSLVLVQYLMPFCAISFVYIQMAICLWGTRAPGNAQDVRDVTLMRNKKKVIKMLIIVVIVFGGCWLPLQLYNILYVTIPEINEYHFISIIWFSCDWLAMSNSCCNPFIYGIYNEKFKREFNKRFAKFFCKIGIHLEQNDRATASLPTRASSMRSSYANSSMRLRCRGGTLLLASSNGFNTRNQQAILTTPMLRNSQNGGNDIPLQPLKRLEQSYPMKNNCAAAGAGNGNEIGEHIDPGPSSSSNGIFKYQWQKNVDLFNTVVVENEDSQSFLDLQIPMTSSSFSNRENPIDNYEAAAAASRDTGGVERFEPNQESGRTMSENSIESNGSCALNGPFCIQNDFAERDFRVGVSSKDVSSIESNTPTAYWVGLRRNFSTNDFSFAYVEEYTKPKRNRNTQSRHSF